jgi:predicted ATP-grasp superfamily ATP-dependent carboligase
VQQFLDGEPCSAVYVADQATAHLVGTTRQLVGEDWLHAKTFQYCGSIGPLPLSHRTQKVCTELGQVLASEFSLKGLFGIDAVLRDDGLWPVEINPRYTASVEVLEIVTGISALAMHAQAFDPVARDPVRIPSQLPEMIGKAIYYAKANFTFPEGGPWLKTLESPRDPWQLPQYADIPESGHFFRTGQPVLTFFARGQTPAVCLEKLAQIAADLDTRFHTQTRT